MIRKLCILTYWLVVSVSLFAQSPPPAESLGASIRIGATVSTFNPDWGCVSGGAFSCWNHHLWGVAPFVDVDRLFLRRIGVEAEARFLDWHSWKGGVTEASYLIGPESKLVGFRNLTLKGKFLVGGARITIPQHQAGNGDHFAYAPGGILEYRLSSKLLARADYEYQIWPSFSGRPAAGTTGKGGLTPNGVSFGLSYKIKR